MKKFLEGCNVSKAPAYKKMKNKMSGNARERIIL